MLRTGRLLAPFQGLRRSASTTGISPDAGSRATGDPGVSPDRTRTGRLPWACARFPLPSPPPSISPASELLDARKRVANIQDMTRRHRAVPDNTKRSADL